ncbi:MAG TPA: DUF1385 domain-containing protein [Miltoncostaeaceae bacterium]|nr:DUF1385 domain-containing protein [Miltoncostaeaceae bacterium]
MTSWSVAVRRPDETIHVVDGAISPWAHGRRWLRVPIVRGVVALAESLVLGLRALAISADHAAGEVADEEGEGGEGGLSRTAIGFTLGISLVVAVGLFFILPIFITNNLLDIGGSFSFWIVEGVIRLAIFLGYLWLISLMPDLRRVFQYHAAEHMAIHAHEAGAPLEPGPVSHFSRLHVRCGTAFLLIVMVVSIFVFAAVGRPSFMWLVISRIVGVPVVAGLSYEVIRWAGRHKETRFVRAVMAPGLLLQRLTTRTCEDEHLEVSCAALTRVLELEVRPPAWAAEVEVMA